MSKRVESISIRGKQRAVPSIQVGQKAFIVIRGTGIRIGSIHDEFWLESKDISEPETIIGVIRRSDVKIDIFTFAQKLPDISPHYSYYMEWDSIAVTAFRSYEEWYEDKIIRHARKNIKKSIRENVRTEVSFLTDEFVEGVCSIYNESEIRQGRRFWHYGKSFSAVKRENSSYLERSIFVGAYYGDELIGYVKFILDKPVAHLMQIVSKSAHSEKRPTNALLSKVVEICSSKDIKYLTYGSYQYNKKKQSSLIDFKRNNGFEEMNVPRYYIPITLKGRVSLKLGLHKGVASWLPASVESSGVALREMWYNFKMRNR